MSRENIKTMGKRAEDLAAYFLIKDGYEILERNFYSRFGEIDIIVTKDDFVVFVEVKYRRNDTHGTPSMAVNFRKQEKMKKTALHYIGMHEIVDKDFRFDIIEVMGAHELRLKHIDNAFH